MANNTTAVFKHNWISASVSLIGGKYLRIIFCVNIRAECAIARCGRSQMKKGNKEKEEEGGRMEAEGGNDQVEIFWWGWENSLHTHFFYLAIFHSSDGGTTNGTSFWIDVLPSCFCRVLALGAWAATTSTHQSVASGPVWMLDRRLSKRHCVVACMFLIVWVAEAYKGLDNSIRARWLEPAIMLLVMSLNAWVVELSARSVHGLVACVWVL
jgi:hypothetical protein